MEADSPRGDAAIVLKAAAAGICIAVVLVGIAYATAPKLVVEVSLHALGAVARLWPGAH